MWGWIKNTARQIWDGVGGGTTPRNGLRWLFHRLIGIFELIWSWLGWIPKKKLRVKVVIRPDDNNMLVATGAFDPSHAAAWKTGAWHQTQV